MNVCSAMLSCLLVLGCWAAVRRAGGELARGHLLVSEKEATAGSKGCGLMTPDGPRRAPPSPICPASATDVQRGPP
jgi:hypothetical protein